MRIARWGMSWVVSAGDIWIATLGTLEDAERYVRDHAGR